MLLSAVQQPVSDPPVLSSTDLVDLLGQVQGNSPPSIDEVTSNPPDLIPGFRVYDSTSIIGKPDLSSAGVYNALTTGEVVEWNATAGTWGYAIDQASFNAAAGRAASSGSPFIIDIESWKLDPLGDGYVTPNPDGSLPATGAGQVINNLIALVNAIKAAKAAYPSVQVGFFSTIDPMGRSQEQWDQASYLWAGYDYSTSSNPAHDARYDLVSQLDFLSPADFMRPGQDSTIWTAISGQRIAEARKMVTQDGTPSKPVYDFLSPYAYDTTNGNVVPVGPDLWRLQLDRERANPDSNGIIIWAAQAATDGGEGWGGPDNQAWWNVTSDFLNGSAVAPAAPTALGGAGIVGSISWSFSGPSPDGFLIERSADGVTWDPSIMSQTGQLNGSFDVAGSITQWTDSFAIAGRSFWYRIAAFNRAGTSSWSNVYQLPAAVDATQITRATGWSSDSWGNTNYATGTGVGNGTTIGYRSLDMGIGANQLRIDLVQWNNASLFQGGTIAVYIDDDPNLPASQPAALIPIGSPDSEIIAGSIPLASGVHDVWFQFTAPLGRLASAGFQSFQFVQSSASDVVLNGSVSNSTSFYLRLESDSKTLDIWKNQTPADGAPTAVYALSSLQSLTINGGAGITTLTVDAINGNPIPAVGLNLNPSTGAGASTTLNLLGTAGDDFLSTYVQSAPGGWDHIVAFDWAKIDLGVSAYVGPLATLNYATGGGNDALSIGNYQAIYLLQNNNQPTRLSTVAIGQWAAKLVSSNSAASDSTNIQQLEMAAYDGTDSIGTFDLQNQTAVVEGIEVLGLFGTTAFTQSQFVGLLTTLSNGHGILSSLQLSA